MSQPFEGHGKTMIYIGVSNLHAFFSTEGSGFFRPRGFRMLVFKRRSRTVRDFYAYGDYCGLRFSPRVLEKSLVKWVRRDEKEFNKIFDGR